MGTAEPRTALVMVLLTKREHRSLARRARREHRKIGDVVRRLLVRELRQRRAGVS